MSAAARPRAGAGCVVHAGDGLVEVLTDRGRVVAGLGGALLARVARDGDQRPEVGDWVTLTWWPDGPVTVDRSLRRREPERRTPGRVVALTRRRA